MNDSVNNPITNNPDIEPMEKLDEICNHLKEHLPTAHYPGDGDSEYDYLEPDCACITLKNPYNDGRMFIDLADGEFTVTYGAWHTHYLGCASGYQRFLKSVDGILTNRVCAASLFAGPEKHWLGSISVTKEEAEMGEIRKIFHFVFKTPEFRKEIQEKGGVAEFRFWNPVDNRDVIV